MSALALALALRHAAPATPPDAAAAERASIALRGTLQESGVREPLAGMQVVVVPEPTDLPLGPVRRSNQLGAQVDAGAWIEATTTDEDGTFAFASLPAGRVRIVVAAAGYERYEQIVAVPLISKRPLVLSIAPLSGQEYRTVVQPDPAEEPGRVTTRSLSREEVATLPGAQGDPLRALQNFPGVARTPGGLGLLVLRGAAPNQSRVFYGEHAMPRAFHVLALSSLVPADAIEKVDFLPGNAPARYGEATGGVVAITPRQLSAGALHGYGDIDLAGAGALMRGSVGKAAFLVAANRSWIDIPLRVAGRIAEEQLTLPQYSDYLGLYQRRLAGGARLEARLIGALDRVIIPPPLDSEESFSSRPEFRFGAQFHRADLVYERRRKDWRFTLSPSFRLERNALESDGDNLAERTDFITSWRVEAEHRLFARASLLLGTDGEIDPYRAAQDEYEPSPDGVGFLEARRKHSRGVQTTVGAYATADVTLGALSLWPGVRVSGATAGTAAAVAADPRFAGRWAFGERWAWSFGAGLYSQSFVPQLTGGFDLFDNLTSSIASGVVLPAAFLQLEPRAGFAPNGNAVSFARAAQVSTSMQFRPDPLWLLELGGYGRLRDTNSVSYADPYAPRGGSTSTNNASIDYGLEVLVRRLPGRKLYGWLSYTLARSEGRVLGPLPRGLPRRFSQPFDQRHMLTLVASYRLPRHWRIGGRFRVVSGSPFTDIVGVIDGPLAISQIPLFGAPNAGRFPTFHQLDLRVDKRWYRRRAAVTTYLDVQNVYNRANVEAYTYGYADYHRREGAIGLPIFPTLGIRVDW